MKVTFDKRWVMVRAKYVCECGFTFYRKNRDWFTMNPFNHSTEKESADKIRKELQGKVRCCPKCQSSVKPVDQTRHT